MTDYEREKFMASLEAALRPLVKALEEIAVQVATLRRTQDEALNFQRRYTRGRAHD